MTIKLTCSFAYPVVDHFGGRSGPWSVRQRRTILNMWTNRTTQTRIGPWNPPPGAIFRRRIGSILKNLFRSNHRNKTGSIVEKFNQIGGDPSLLGRILTRGRRRCRWRRRSYPRSANNETRPRKCSRRRSSACRLHVCSPLGRFGARRCPDAAPKILRKMTRWCSGSRADPDTHLRCTFRDLLIINLRIS